MKSGGVTQSFLAEVLGTSQAAISNYLSGRIPHSDKLFGIANYFQVSIDDLLQRDLTKTSKEPVAGPVRRRLAFDALTDHLAGLPDDECERLCKVLLNVLKHLKSDAHKNSF